MEYKLLRDEKNEIELEIDNLTIAELLRVELNKDDSVKLTAWRREHISKNPILLIQTEGKSPKKALKDAIEKIQKATEKLVDSFKKAK